MKVLQQRLYVIVLIGIVGVLVSACASPPLEVFLSPNPSFVTPKTQSQPTPQRQEPVYPQSSPTEQIIVQSDTRLGENRIVFQMSEALAEAQAHVHAGEARLQEQNPLEAIREFERARILIEEGVDPALQYVQQTAQIQGGMQILSDQRIQSIHNQRSEILGQINQAYDFRTMYGRQKELDQIDFLRESTKPTLQPVQVTQPQPSSRRIVEQRVEQQPASHGINWALLAQNIDPYINRFQQRHKEFHECLVRANQYFPTVTSILSTYGVPEDLAYVALIESGFQPSIESSSGDVGLWQLSRSIAQSYGLEVSSSRDERNDIQAATRVFAQYISYLHRKFGSWELAILGYEQGEQGLQNTLNRVGSYEIQAISQQSGRASEEREFLAKLAAAMTIARNPKAYGFNIDLPNISRQITVQVKKPTPAISVMTEPPVSTLY
jgi:hypothetical protein